MVNSNRLNDFKLPPELLEKEKSGDGRIEFDELGNPVWVPSKPGAEGDTAIMRLLDTKQLKIQDDPESDHRPVRANPVGTKKGYDPYDSGVLSKDRNKKKRNMRELSKWIETRKKLGLSTKED